MLTSKQINSQVNFFKVNLNLGKLKKCEYINCMLNVKFNGNNKKDHYFLIYYHMYENIQIILPLFIIDHYLVHRFCSLFACSSIF